MKSHKEGVRTARNGHTPEAPDHQVKDKAACNPSKQEHLGSTGLFGLHGLRDPLDYSREEGVENARRVGAYALMLEDAYNLRDDKLAAALMRRIVFEAEQSKAIVDLLETETAKRGAR